jgi:glycine cleavage system H protein
MPNVRGCHLPDDLLYDVDNHIWYRELPTARSSSA